MQIKFCKYQGTGNDFILLNNIDGKYNDIGEDEVKFLVTVNSVSVRMAILLNSSVAHDFYMDFSNPDGSKSFCGNGARCAVKFAGDNGFFLPIMYLLMRLMVYI